MARAAFDAVIGKRPEGIVALGAPGYVDDLVAFGQVRGHQAIGRSSANCMPPSRTSSSPPTGSWPRNLGGRAMAQSIRLFVHSIACGHPGRAPRKAVMRVEFRYGYCHLR